MKIAISSFSVKISTSHLYRLSVLFMVALIQIFCDGPTLTSVIKESQKHNDITQKK